MSLKKMARQKVGSVKPSPLDSLSHKWERGPFPALGLMLPFSRAEFGRRGQGDEGMFKSKLDIPESIGLFAASSKKGGCQRDMLKAIRELPLHRNDIYNQ